MGAEGYNEMIWIISDECALVKTIPKDNEVCCVCREKIKTSTCFKLDELHYCCNKVAGEYDKCYCWSCARKLVIQRESVSR